VHSANRGGDCFSALAESHWLS